MRRPLLSLFLAALCIGVLAAPAAAAGKPDRVFLGLPDFLEFDAGTVCDFALRIDILVNKEYAVIFPADESGTQHDIVTGRLVVEVTNVDTGQSRVFNVSGPGKDIFFPDGTVQTVQHGRFIFFALPTDAGGPGMWWSAGQNHLTFDANGATTSVSLPHNSLDVCAALAPLEGG
jgi:hypothetical protein